MHDTILPHDLPAALDGREGLSVLSLDCFDTLIWRDCHAPADIFAALPGTTPLQRIWAESRARKAALHGRGRHEVSIGEIYAQLLPNAPASERAQAIAAELDAEGRHCFAFAPTVALMREAKARAMQVIIVSDTYLDAAQLRDLIAAAAGDDVAALIDRIFCSSVHGKSKGEGLYAEVLRKLKAKPAEILHIGDNRMADCEGIAPFGVNVLHLDQFADPAKKRLRLESSLSAMIHADTGEAVAALQPHRAALALAERASTDPAMQLGCTALGPVKAGFEHWLQGEARALEAQHGGSVHWLFLMRDGHLPLLVHKASRHPAPAHAVEISRFTAIASSFRSEPDVARYAELELGTNPATLARQLLIGEDEIARLTEGRDPSEASHALLAEMRKGQRRKATLRASRAFAERLAAHVRAVVDPRPGDTLMLVDLGYNGTVQNHIDAVLREALGVQVAGRYLLLRETDRPGLDKRGFLSSEHYDAHTLEALCANVAVLEQVSTLSAGSVVDYEADGTPIRKENDIKGRQSAVRDRIQAGCLHFQRSAREAILRPATPHADALWRQGAASALARLLFLPLDEELAVIERFEHDVNLGTERTVPLFDRAVAERGMRRRGLFYMKGAERMYLPAELAGQGLPARLTYLAHKRFGLPLAHGDFTDHAIELPVIFAHQDEMTQRRVSATPTHDGWYMAAIPVGDCRYSLALQFGARWEWLQVDSLAFQPLPDFLSESHEADGREIAALPMLEAMEQTAPHLFRCEDEGAFMMVHPPERLDDTPMLLTVAFRPLAERREALMAGDVAEPRTLS